jgi:molybdate transport system substrate-binding protein
MLAILLLLLTLPARAQTPPPVMVFAASSLTGALSDIATGFAATGHPPPKLVFGASSDLAREIDAGAPAQVFISADQNWMDFLARQNLIVPASRADIAGNSLVLIGPQGAAPLTLTDKTQLAARLAGGRLAMADPASVPAGRYGQAALSRLGLWQGVAAQIAPAADVRAALRMVQQQAAELGIVYGSDAKTAAAITVVAAFPEASHAPIRYPAAIIAGTDNQAEARAFLNYLQGPQALGIFLRDGFTAVTSPAHKPAPVPPPALGAPPPPARHCRPKRCADSARSILGG